LKETEPTEFAKEAERALQEAVYDAIEEHRRAGRPIVVEQDGKLVKVDPRKVLTVREKRAKYGKDQQ
jgi:hypothetical protein